jgi:phosphinothricin acetyltransferase
MPRLEITGLPPGHRPSPPPASALSFAIEPMAAHHLAAVATIYRNQIEDGLGSDEHPLPGLDEMARRHEARLEAGLPDLVAVDAARLVLGFTWASPFRFKSHYRWTVEDSIHVHRRARRYGVGRALLAALVEACALRGYRQMIAVVGDARNIASIRLHERLGFRACAYFPSIGRKAGRWLDTVMLQRDLGASHPRH